MASDVAKTLIIGLSLFVLFASIILTVAIDFGAEYDHSASEIGGGVLDLEKFNNSASSVESNASVYRASFESGDIPDVDTPTGIWATAKSLIFMITTPFTLLGSLMVGFGVPEIFVSVILGVLGITLIFAIWSVLRKGD